MPPKKKVDTEALDIVAPSLDDRLAALMNVTSKQAERWGLKDAVAIPAYEPAKFKRRVFSTGLTSLDQLLKTGGYPRGHIVEFYGPLSSGKSLALYKTISEAQHTCLHCEGRLDYSDKLDNKNRPITKTVQMSVRGEMQDVVVNTRTSVCRSCGAVDSGALCVLVDQENSVDPPWLKRQNIELTKIVVLKLPTGEHATEMLRSIMLSVKPDLIGIDSIAQLQPKTEQAKSEVDDSVMPGLHAKVMARLCRQITSIFLMDPKNAPVFIWVNQMRADVSGNGKDVVTGGYAPEFYSALRIKFNASKMVNLQQPGLGTEGKLTIKKCKISEGAKNRTIEYTLLDSGFDTIKDLYLTAVGSDVFLRSALGSGSHFWAEDSDRTNKLATSREGAMNRLREDPGFADEVRKRVYSRMHVSEVQDIYIGPPQEEPAEYIPSEEDVID